MHGTTSMSAAPVSPAEAAAVTLKVGRRLLPFLVLCFLVAFLDRVNVGFAALHMNRALGFTPSTFGLGAGIFFLGYFLFEIPSNLALHRFGARRWIARIMVSWGVLACCCALVRGEPSFLLLRFLLGAAEAGFFPGVLLYLTLWFPDAVRGRVMSLFSLGSVVSLVIGAPLSGLVLGIGTRWGIQDWQWLFVLEGIPSILLGIAALFVLTDRPADAGWLSDAERDALQALLCADRAAAGPVAVRTGVLAVLRDPRVMLLSLAAMLNIMAMYGVTMWLPQLLHGLGAMSDVRLGVIAALPFLCTALAMNLNARHADRGGDRRWHILACALGGAIGLLVAALATSAALGLGGLCLAAAGIWSSNTVFWTVPMRLFSGASAAASLAMINSIGNLGGFLGPFVTGSIREATGSYAAALLCLGAGLAVFGLVLFLFLGPRDRHPVSAPSESLA